jgi:hypothetical protein
MKHEILFVEISEWLRDSSSRSALDALSELIKFLSERGYQSLELEISSLLKRFLDVSVDQCTIIRDDPTSRKSTVSLFTTCLKRDGSLFFVDIEEEGGRIRLKDEQVENVPSAIKVHDIPDTEEGTVKIDPTENEELRKRYVVEVDIFSRDSSSLLDSRGTIIDDIMRCFGLTKSKEALMQTLLSTWPAAQKLRKRLKSTKPIDESLFQRLREESERNILRELKKRGSILERDLAELTSPGITPEQVKRTLDYFSGEEYLLVERKYAILCNATEEIIFLLRSRDDIQNAKNLECPKCSRPIGDETVLYYYGITDNLKALLDGNRWMPLLVRDALIKAGVPKEDIYTEVKYGEDEIDLLVFYRGRIIIMEVKNRSINLNDAYKLSAKTSRIESVVTRVRPDDYEYVYRNVGIPRAARLRGGRVDRAPFIPFVISTHEVAKDARELLCETRDSAQIVENCETKLEKLIENFIGKINSDELKQRLSKLTFNTESDSVTYLAASQVELAFHMWLQNIGE